MSTTIKEHIKSSSFTFQTLLISLVISAMQFFVLEIGISFKVYNLAPKYLFSGYILVSLIFFTILFISNNIIVDTIITGLLSLIVSIVNHFCYIFHGSPLTISDIKNAATAANVMESYSFSLNSHIVLMIAVFILEILLSIWAYKKYSSNRKSSFIASSISFIAVYIVFFSQFAYIPSNLWVWRWREALMEYGFVNITVVTTQTAFNYFPEPASFDKNSTAEFCEQYENIIENSNHTPDVILILNESFYELKQITNPETDIDYLYNINSLENSIHGYAINSVIGGHTNASEYELLTSNTLINMPGITPFNTIDLTDSNSIVQHLESIGYNTFGAHCAPEKNYNRAVSYNALGFDSTHFVDDFQGLEPYDDRYFVTDESVYKNLTNWYKSMGDAPRFMYLLTIQNHGDYNINPSSSDVVHTSNDYGEYTDYVNEYLSCIHLSDLAFKELTDYYRNVDREVVILMVGDHCPSFAPNVVDSSLSDEEANIKLRSIPFVIWSNTPALLENYNVSSEAISMPYLVPTLLETAGIEVSGYYDYLISQRQIFPILSKDNIPQELTNIEYLNVKFPTLAKDYFK